MKKRGFTLIELLAVIVVLAIIALIATPIVMNVIKNAQMGAAERSADNYVKAVDTLIATEKLDGTPLIDGEYTIGTDGKIAKDGKSYEVEVSGTKPTGGTIVVKDGQVVKDSSTINYKDYIVTFENGKAKAEAGETKKLMTLADCDFVSGTENTVGAEYTCDLGNGEKTFYVLEAGTSSKPATLILEGNYDTTTQAWCASGSDNSCAADGLNAKLDEIAGKWTKLDRSQIGIPSASQIVVADGQAENAYLDYPVLSKKWLSNWDNGVWGNTVFGYWTSTPASNGSINAHIVIFAGGIGSNVVDSGSDIGVRPTILLEI